MSAESSVRPSIFLSEAAPLVFIPLLDHDHANSCIMSYIQRLFPFFIVNHIRYAVGSWGAFPSADLCYAPAIQKGSKDYSMLFVLSMHPSSSGFRCAERIKRYREPVYPSPVYISRYKKPDVRVSCPIVWDQFTIPDNKDIHIFLQFHQDELARQTVRGICDYFKVSYRDPHIS